jgi:predicted permease
MNPPDNPVRLLLPADLRVLGFSVLLALAVTLLFGLAPAMRASGVRPAVVLKGGGDPHAKRRLMHGLIAVQVAFCCIVLLIGGLFVATYQQLAHQPTGFSSDRLLALNTVTSGPQLPVYWSQVAAHLRAVPGVESVTLADRPLLSGGAWNGFVSIGGRPPGTALAFFRAVSPGWMEAMKIPLLDGRDFREEDVFPGAAIVNETFAKTYFPGENPVGKSFSRGANERHRIIGLVRDTRYRNMRDPILPAAFFPFPATDARGLSQPRSEAALIVRTAAQNPLALASFLRREVTRARSAFRVSSIRSQQEINDAHTVSERLLALLALFFTAVALLLAGVGLYGVLDYSVLQRRREIGIRMALGARAANVARQVTLESFVMVLLGAVAGLGCGMAAERYIVTLLYQVRVTDPAMLALPSALLFIAALLAVTPPAIRAVRTDPARTLRAD